LSLIIRPTTAHRKQDWQCRQTTTSLIHQASPAQPKLLHTFHPSTGTRKTADIAEAKLFQAGHWWTADALPNAQLIALKH